MNRKKHKDGKENIEDNRSPKRLKKDNEKDLLGDSLQVDMSFNLGQLRLFSKRHMKKSSQPGSCEQNPTSFTKLLQSMRSHRSIFVGSPNFLESNEALPGAALSPSMVNIPGTKMRNDSTGEISNAGSIDPKLHGRTDRSIMIIMQNKKKRIAYTERDGSFHSIGKGRFHTDRPISNYRPIDPVSR
ncbi:hypothetical protein YC2023_116340 [Brassica napus]